MDEVRLSDGIKLKAYRGCTSVVSTLTSLPSVLINAGVTLLIIHQGNKIGVRPTDPESRWVTLQKKRVCSIYGRPARPENGSFSFERSASPSSPLLHLDDSPFFPAIFYHSSICPDLNIPFSGMQNQPDPTHVPLHLNFLLERDLGRYQLKCCLFLL